MSHSFTASPVSRACAQVVRLPLRKVEPGSAEALLLPAQHRAAWLRANPGASFEQEMQAGAEIAKELGL